MRDRERTEREEQQPEEDQPERSHAAVDAQGDLVGHFVGQDLYPFPK